MEFFDDIDGKVVWLDLLYGVIEVGFGIGVFFYLFQDVFQGDVGVFVKLFQVKVVFFFLDFYCYVLGMNGVVDLENLYKKNVDQGKDFQYDDCIYGMFVYLIFFYFWFDFVCLCKNVFFEVIQVVEVKILFEEIDGVC